MEMNGTPGFICIDGIEGSGKSLQAKMLHEHIPGSMLVADPGTTEIGKQIRQLLLDPSSSMRQRTEVMLFMAARAEMAEAVIRPALRNGQVVITDRFVSSTVAYQNSIDIDVIYRAAEVALDGLLPEITFILDLPAEVAMQRVQPKFEVKPGEKRLDRFEVRSLDYHRIVRGRYLALVERWPYRFGRLPVEDRTPEEVHEWIKGNLKGRL